MTETLTNEALKGICANNFDLVQFAINLGRYFIASGRDCNLKDILRDIRKHPDPHYIEELKEIDEIERRSKERETPQYE